jgi:hypothetical protein
MTLSVELMLRAAEKITLVLEASATTRFGSIIFMDEEVIGLGPQSARPNAIRCQ